MSWRAKLSLFREAECIRLYEAGQIIVDLTSRLDDFDRSDISLALPARRTKPPPHGIKTVPQPPRGPALKATSSSTHRVFYRCSAFLPHDPPETIARCRADLSVRNTGIEMVRRLKELVDVGTFGS